LENKAHKKEKIMPNQISDPNSMTSSAAAKVCYKIQAEYFRVNDPDAAQETAITEAVEAFTDAFPEQRYRFDGKRLARKLRRLGQIIDDVYFQIIIGNASLKAKLEAAMGLV
jgi:hypothetical protein